MTFINPMKLIVLGLLQSGLKEYVGANPTLKSKYATVVVHRKVSDDSTYSSENEDTEVKDEFYDAISADSSSSEGSDDEDRPKSEVVLFYLFFSCFIGI